MRPFPLLALTLGAAGLVGSACACDLCNVYHAPLAHGLVEQGFHLAIAEQFTHFGTLQEDGREIPNPTDQFLDSSITQIAAGYHFNDGLKEELNEIEVPGAPESGIHGHDLALGSGSYDGQVGTDSVSWKSRLSAEIGAAFPVLLDNSAVQAVPDYRILAGFVWRF